MFTIASLLRAFLFSLSLVSAGSAIAQAKPYSFAYDQPKTSAYGYGADVFGKRLSELSKGSLSINQYAGAQLGSEAQTLQKVQTGDIDFVLVSTANASTIQPESGVFSLHYIFRSPEHTVKVLTDARVIAAMREMYAAKVKGAHMLTLGTQGLRNLYCKKEIRNVGDLKNVRCGCRPPPPKTRSSPPTARRSSTCRSVMSTPR
ncbi:MAG: TRAP transporter substrate-binding protein DctP, partial [Pseudomonadota bacterium]|nr:TRAP transporter substrate-binding protein DctP [Pseudomonadota bacterium]